MNEQEVIDALKTYGIMADSLSHMIHANTLTRQIPEKELQEKFMALRHEIGSEYKRLSSARTEKSEMEVQFLWPAIQDAWANTGLSKIRSNSKPQRSWGALLCEISFYMRYWTPNPRIPNQAKLLHS